MTTPVRRVLGLLPTAIVLLTIGGAAVRQPSASPQPAPERGRSIGTISTQGDLIVMTLDEGALGAANLFDLAGRTLRFTPDAGGYRGENLPLQWDAEFGAALSEPGASFRSLAFPFSVLRWS
jgi:hypothetical protein